MEFVQLARFGTLESRVGPLEEEAGLTTLLRMRGMLLIVALIKYSMR